MKDEMATESPWYRGGLRFECAECGWCCTIPGFVWVGGMEIRRMASHLGMSHDRFGRKYLRRIGSRLSLTERGDGSCIFWDRGCEVYPVRPRQCRTFPFWEDHLESRAHWERLGIDCGGIGKGRLYRIGEIEELRDGRRDTSGSAGRTPADPVI